MRSRQLGTNGLKVSAIGLGCMGLSHAYGPALSKEDAVRILRKAVDLGVTLSYRFPAPQSCIVLKKISERLPSN